MATDALTDKKEERTSRMDMRLTASERSQFERAAATRGMSLTQWATTHLVDASRQDIEDAITTRLSAEAFETFSAALDEPLPEVMQDLLTKKPIWA